MTEPTKIEIKRLDSLAKSKGISHNKINRDTKIARMTVSDFFSLKSMPSMENYLIIKKYLETE